MKIKEVFPMLGKTIVSAAKRIGVAFLNANALSLIKFGIVAGTAAATIALIIKFIRDKRRSYTSEEGKSPVDKSLELNYRDAKNHDKLHPLMKKVRKQLIKDIKPKKKNGKRYKGNMMSSVDKLKAAYRRCEIVHPPIGPYGYSKEREDALHARLKHFIENDYLYADADANGYPEYDDDNTTFRRVWDGTFHCWDNQ